MTTPITTETLIGMIEEATEELEICTPSPNYYARRYDWRHSTIRFVNADILKRLLEAHAKWTAEERGNIA